MANPTVPTSMGDLEATVVKEANGRRYAAYISPYEIVVAINGSAKGKGGREQAASENGAAGSAADLVTDLMGIIPREFYSAIKPVIDSFGQPVAVPAIDVYSVRHTGDVGISVSEFQSAWQAGLEENLKEARTPKPGRSVADFIASDIKYQILAVTLFSAAMAFILHEHLRTNALSAVAAGAASWYFASKFHEVVTDAKSRRKMPFAFETLLNARLRYVEK
ncbi:hypothetical protein HYV82_03530 [Candidatus Woesearchaeota archaeon]|nr:hypothetical protein [Candidatus Woesearchaeota archaeon]